MTQSIPTGVSWYVFIL